MFCKKCGNEVTGKYCANCGEPVEDVNDTETNEDYASTPNDVNVEPVEKESFFSSSLVVFGLTILFFPVGLFLMWKYKKLGKMPRIIITTLYMLGLVTLIGTNLGQYKKVTYDNKVNTVETKSNSMESISETKEVLEADKKEIAAEVDKMLYDILVSAESDYTTLGKVMVNEESSMVDLYDASTTAESKLQYHLLRVDKFMDYEGIGDYKTAAENYVFNMYSIAASTRKYVENQSVKDLSDAKANMENTRNCGLSVISERMKFLKASGFSDEDAMSIMAGKTDKE